VAPFAPGGGSDFTSRLIAEKLAARLGQTMIVENKPGAGGNLGAETARPAIHLCSGANPTRSPAARYATGTSSRSG
jgi:tripartite-type tricarboxylate transporter receptor subunit TctC